MISSRELRAIGLALSMGVIGLLAVRAAPGMRYCDEFWPSGVGTAALLLAGRRRLAPGVPIVFAIAAASFVAGGEPWGTSLGLALGVAVECAVVVLILWRGGDGSQSPSLLSNPELIRFMLAVIAGAVAAAAITALVVLAISGPHPPYAFADTLVAHLSSELLILPLVCRVDRHDALCSRAERVVQWTVTLGATAVLLLPLGFALVALVIIPLLAWGALRLPVREALYQTIIVATVIAATTSEGVGSFARLPVLFGLPDQLHNVVAAAFVVDCVFVVLPLALAVASQARTVRLAAAERDKLENIVDSATGVAIIGADALGRITLFNPGAERMLGYTAAEIVGRSTRMLHSAAAVTAKARELGVADDFEVVARVLTHRGYAGTDMGFVRKDGVERVHSMTLTPLIGPDGREVGFVSTSEDVTDRVHAASVLREALDAEREAVERLQEVDALKDAFVSTVSHELRTPITSILGYVEMLGNGSYGVLTTDQDEAVRRVSANSTRLLDLIDDLLTLSRVQESGVGMSRRAFDLRSVVTAGYELVAPTWAGRDLHVTLELPDEAVDFLGDRDMVERVVVNLLGNAVKFTPDGGSIGVVLGLEGSDAVLRVTDTGIGIPADEQRLLFQRFFRSSTAQQKAIRGTGLGLSITKAIVEQHHGSVRVESATEAGSTFEVRMPALV